MGVVVPIGIPQAPIIFDENAFVFGTLAASASISTPWRPTFISLGNNQGFNWADVQLRNGVGGLLSAELHFSDDGVSEINAGAGPFITIASSIAAAGQSFVNNTALMHPFARLLITNKAAGTVDFTANPLRALRWRFRL